MNSRELIKQLETDGWRLRSVKGSHHVVCSPDKARSYQRSAPEEGVGIVRALLKQAGL